jgi:hypothetical protein
MYLIKIGYYVHSKTKSLNKFIKYYKLEYNGKKAQITTKITSTAELEND